MHTHVHAQSIIMCDIIIKCTLYLIVTFERWDYIPLTFVFYIIDFRFLTK